MQSKAETVALSASLACYWSIFVLILFPSELFPSVSPLEGTACFDAAFLCVILVCAGLFALFGQRATRFLLRRKWILASSFLALVILIVLVLLHLLSGIDIPSFLMWTYPVAFGLYSVALTVELAARMAVYPEIDRALIVTGSLLASFALGTSISFFSNCLSIVQSDASYPMAILSGLIVLSFLDRPFERDEFAEEANMQANEQALRLRPSHPQKFAQSPLSKEEHIPCPPIPMAFREKRQDAADASEDVKARNPLDFVTRQGKAAVPAITILMLFLYLVGSAILLGAHSSTAGGLWFGENWIHTLLGFILFLAFVLYAVYARAKQRTPYPWIAFCFICLGTLYLAALFFPTWSVLCKEIVLPTRPLAMVLLWATALSWAQATKRSAAWTACVVAIPLICVSGEFLNTTAALVNNLPEPRLAISGALLFCSFALTACLVVCILADQRIKMKATAEAAASRSSDRPDSEHAIPLDEASRAIADEFALSERETEVLFLLAEGHTQKRIAQDLFVSINSVQTYAKSLYRKLGIHSKQELIDLVILRRE